MKREPLTFEAVRRFFDYDQQTGILSWREPDCVRLSPGERAGSVNDRGYRFVKVLNRSYAETRIIWFWMTGAFPNGTVDHDNRVHDDNRWSNLRDATLEQQHGNFPMRRNNESGFRGVSKRRSRWSARLMVDGKFKSLGTFDTPEAASAVYEAAARQKYGEFYSNPNVISTLTKARTE